MNKLDWIKELVRAEQQSEESGIIDVNTGFDLERALVEETLDFLNLLKQEFTTAVTVFNELRAASHGKIKIYGIARTHADFMLFRNGFKLIFSMRAPGKVSVRFNFLSSSLLPSANASLIAPGVQVQSLMEEDIINAQTGAFGEVVWVHQGLPIKAENVVRFYMTRFTKESGRQLF